jgi:hypothetical protein
MEDMYCDWCGETDHIEDDCPDYENEHSLSDFMGRLENFLDSELDTISRGNVFLTENGESVSMNVVIGAPFEGHDGRNDINQINVIIVPTDRTFLGSEGVSMDDRETFEGLDEELDDILGENSSSIFDRAMRIFRND